MTMGMQMSFDDGVVRGLELGACGSPDRDGESMCDSTGHGPTMAGGGGEGLQSGLPVGRGDG